MTFNMRRAAGTPLTDEEIAELRALAQMPDSEINFADIPERIYEPSGPLEEHTVTLRVDAEVAAWLEKAVTEDANRLNWVLKREATRNQRIAKTPPELLDKAS